MQNLKLQDTFNATGQNLKNETSSITGPQRIVDSNKKCNLLARNNTNFAFFTLNEKLVNGTEVQNPVTSTDMANTQIDDMTIIRVGFNCDKIAINKTIYYRLNVTHWAKT